MTYSIVAKDPETGRLGVAVQSHWFSVGTAVTWAEAGVGAVATQSFVDRSYGPLGLDLMRRGRPAPDALETLVRADEHEGTRQVAFVDAAGRVAAHSGDDCIRAFGHITGDGYCVQANMMERDTVWASMARAYESASGDLPDRLVAALAAAQAEGGDIRGSQSAAMLIVEAEPTGSEWLDRVLELRVEDHHAPVDELERLVVLWRAYDHSERSERFELDGDLDAALQERLRALEIAPKNPEVAFWGAIALAQAGRLDEASRTVAVAYADEPRWQELLRRIVADGQVDLTDAQVDALRPSGSP